MLEKHRVLVGVEIEPLDKKGTETERVGVVSLSRIPSVR